METLDRMPWAAKNSVFRRLAEIGEVSNMSKDEREKYDSALRHYRDTLNVIQGAEEKGRMQGRMETAKKLKSMGSTTRFIQEATGLTEDEINRL